MLDSVSILKQCHFVTTWKRSLAQMLPITILWVLSGIVLWWRLCRPQDVRDKSRLTLTVFTITSFNSPSPIKSRAAQSTRQRFRLRLAGQGTRWMQCLLNNVLKILNCSGVVLRNCLEFNRPPIILTTCSLVEDAGTKFSSKRRNHFMSGIKDV